MPVRKGEPLDPTATRRHVLATASSLFYDRGTHPVGVNEIADTAGVSKLTLYRHFDSKEGLVRAFLEAHSDAIVDGLRAIAAREGLDARGRILAIFDALAAMFDDPRYRGCALMNTAAEWRGTDSEAGDLARRHVERIHEVVGGLCEAAGVADPGRTADQLVLLIEGAMALRMTHAMADPAGAAREAAALLLDAHGG